MEGVASDLGEEVGAEVVESLVFWGVVMNVVIVTPWLGVGGAETYVLLKSRWLVERGYGVTVISGGGEWVSRLSEGVRHVQFSVEVSPAAFSSVQYDEYLRQLAGVIVRAGADVVEVHNSSPVVHVAQSFRYHHVPFFVNILNEFSYRRNPFLVAVTRRCAPLGNLYTINAQAVSYINSRLGCDVDWRVMHVPVEGVPDGVGQQGDYVLSVGRMATDKRYIIYAVRGFGEAVLSGRLPGMPQMRIVGDGPIRKEVEEEVVRVNEVLGREAVVLLGTLSGEALWREYRGARLFVGSGTSMLLAASVGVPAFVVGYTPRSVEYAWGVWGEDSLDVERFCATEKLGWNPMTYADAMVAYWNCGKADKAIAMFRANYDVESIMESWESEFEQVVGLDFEKVCFDIRALIRVYRPVWWIYDKMRTR